MRTKGTATELQKRRELAVQRVKDGYRVADVAAFLGVDVSSVNKWVSAERMLGAEGLKAKPAKGRHRKLSPRQEHTVLSWFTQSARRFGFLTELWTAPRVAALIKKRWNIDFHPRYLNHWLAQRHITPQKPARVARERNQKEIDRWTREEWPRIQKTHAS
jgi:transposase